MKKITLERPESKDHYRLQVNVDQDTIAFGYNLLIEDLNREEAAELRNKLSDVTNDYLLHRFGMRLEANPSNFSDKIRQFVIRNVDESARPRARRFYVKQGWKPK